MGKIIQANDLRVKDRVNLGEACPLPGPLVMYVEPTSLCNLRCQFCPTGYKDLRSQRPNGQMKLELVYKILVDLQNWGHRPKRIIFYKDGEPLVHTGFPALVRWFYMAKVTDSLWTKTNGLNLAPELNQKLVSCGLNWIGVSINGLNEQDYQTKTRTRVDFKKLVAGVRDLYDRRGKVHLYVKLLDSGFSESEIQQFYDIFQPISDTCAVEKMHNWSTNGGKDLMMGQHPDTFEGIPLVEKIACPVPFYHMVINWDGTIEPCVEDWQHGEMLGDVNLQSLEQIWGSLAMQKFWLMHLRGNRQLSPICGRCYFQKTVPDNIDPYRAEITRRITNV